MKKYSYTNASLVLRLQKSALLYAALFHREIKKCFGWDNETFYNRSGNKEGFSKEEEERIIEVWYKLCVDTISRVKPDAPCFIYVNENPEEKVIKKDMVEKIVSSSISEIHQLNPEIRFIEISFHCKSEFDSGEAKKGIATFIETEVDTPVDNSLTYIIRS